MVAQLRQAISQQTTVAVGSPDLPESVLDWAADSKPLSESPLTTDRDSTKNREQSSRANALLSEPLSELPVRLDGKLGLISSETQVTLGELPSSPTTEPDGDENLVSLPIRENTPMVSESLAESPAIFADSSDLKEPLSKGTVPSVSQHKCESLNELPIAANDNNRPEALSVVHERLFSESEPLDNLPSSSLPTEGNKNSHSVPFQLTGAALARRLNVSPSTLRHKKNAKNFGKWTSGHDPDGIAWYFDGQKFIVHTVTDTQ